MPFQFCAMPAQKMKMLMLLTMYITHYNTYGQHLLNALPVTRSIIAAQYSLREADPLICSANPAVIPASSDLALSAYAEKRFMMPDLMFFTGAATAGMGKQVLSTAFIQFGSALHNENSLSLSCGRTLGRLDIGISLGFHSIKFQNVSKETVAETAIACRMKINDQVFSSFRISNAHSLFNRSDESYRSTPSFMLGIGFDASQKVYIGGECERKMEGSTDGTFILRYYPALQYRIRVAWNTYSHQPFFGIAWNKKNFMIETGFNYHNVLGVSPAIIVQYQRGGRKS